MNPAPSALTTGRPAGYSRRSPKGSVLQNTKRKAACLPDSEALSRLNISKRLHCGRSIGCGRDGATCKGARTSLRVF